MIKGDAHLIDVKYNLSCRGHNSPGLKAHFSGEPIQSLALNILSRDTYRYAVEAFQDRLQPSNSWATPPLDCGGSWLDP